LYRTNTSLSREDEIELAGHLPELHDLPRPEEFEASLNERNRLSMEELELRSDLWKSGVPEGSPEELEALAASLSQAVEPLTGQEKWKLEAVYAGKYGGAHRKPWDQLVELSGWSIAMRPMRRSLLLSTALRLVMIRVMRTRSGLRVKFLRTLRPAESWARSRYSRIRRGANSSNRQR